MKANKFEIGDLVTYINAHPDAGKFRALIIDPNYIVDEFGKVVCQMFTDGHFAYCFEANLRLMTDNDNNH